MLGRKNEKNSSYVRLSHTSIFGFCFMPVCLMKSNFYSLIYSSLALIQQMCQYNFKFKITNYCTLKKEFVDPQQQVPYLILVCFDRSSAEFTGELILEFVKKAANMKKNNGILNTNLQLAISKIYVRKIILQFFKLWYSECIDLILPAKLAV